MAPNAGEQLLALLRRELINGLHDAVSQLVGELGALGVDPAFDATAFAGRVLAPVVTANPVLSALDRLLSADTDGMRARLRGWRDEATDGAPLGVAYVVSSGGPAVVALSIVPAAGARLCCTPRDSRARRRSSFHSTAVSRCSYRDPPTRSRWPSSRSGSGGDDAGCGRPRRRRVDPRRSGEADRRRGWPLGATRSGVHWGLGGGLAHQRDRPWRPHHDQRRPRRPRPGLRQEPGSGEPHVPAGDRSALGTGRRRALRGQPRTRDAADGI